jgi:alpha-tubulin suppressor-like RCC1 family protein
VRGEPGEEDDEPSLPDVTAIATGGFHSCGIDHDGDVRCWGDDAVGQLGLPEGEDFVFGRPQDIRSFGP